MYNFARLLHCLLIDFLPLFLTSFGHYAFLSEDFIRLRYITHKLRSIFIYPHNFC